MIHVIVKCILFFAIPLLFPIIAQDIISAGSGCRDGTTEALQDDLHPKMAACKGSWKGHVRNSTFELCAPGWKVCSWHDYKLLRTIKWKDAIKIKGCYAFSAAQDNSQCGPCLDDDVMQDNMAGVGHACSRSHRGQRSCIEGGKIEASCCRDAQLGMACKYRKGLISGVLCCKMTGVAPRIISQPPPSIHVTAGDTFILSCLSSGSPRPSITWLKGGVKINMSTPRISVSDSGYLIIADSREDDDGWYHCLSTNRIGGHSSTPSRVIVRDHESGCKSGRTSGFFEYEDIQACQGHWKGHVKNGKVVCARGWQVCNPGHVALLKMITWYDVTHQLEGCYAYNAEVNKMGLCSPCVNGPVSGVGSKCGFKSIEGRSCLAEGVISVSKMGRSHKGQGSGCRYPFLKGRVDGVLCCKRSRKKNKSSSLRWKDPKCVPSCDNGGVCTAGEICVCTRGYQGKYCQIPICQGGCPQNSECIKPRHCRCKKGYYGPHCLDG